MKFLDVLHYWHTLFERPKHIIVHLLETNLSNLDMYATCAASKMSKELQEIVVLSIRLSAGISPKGQNFMLDSAAFTSCIFQNIY